MIWFAGVHIACDQKMKYLRNEMAQPGEKTVKLTAFCPVGLGEDILAVPIGDGVFKVREQPAEIPGLHLGDIVYACDGRIDRVIWRSNYRGCTVVLKNKAKQGKFLSRLGKCGGVAGKIRDDHYTVVVPRDEWGAIRSHIKQSRITIDPDWDEETTFR